MARIAIRREDKNRWERRAPLTPEHVRQLVAQGIEVTVQPSPIRVFTDAEYQHAGAAIHEDLSECPLVFGVKEVPIDVYDADTSYMIFSHTHKAQGYNMPMLKRILEQRVTLIDYEIVCNDAGQRLIFFGRYAGLAGMINTLWSLGRRLVAEGTPNPFDEIKCAYEYKDLEEARAAVAHAGERITSEGLPAELSPFVCGFSGYGRVSMGAQEIFDLLPHHDVDPETLPTLDAGDGARHTVYKTVFREEHMYRRADGGEYSFEHFVANPESYAPNFERFLQHMDVLVHGIYWEERFPRLITREALAEAWKDGKSARLKIIGDITCDIRGSIACTVKPTESDDPVYIYDPSTDDAVSAHTGQGPLVLAVDNLPCELPRDASEEFGRALLPFVPAMARAHASGQVELDALPAPIRGAIITTGGKLVPPHEHLEAHLPR